MDEYTRALALTLTIDTPASAARAMGVLEANGAVVLKNFFDPSIMKPLGREIARQFAIPENSLELPPSEGTRLLKSRNLWPDFIGDDALLHLYRRFTDKHLSPHLLRYFGGPYFGGTRSTISVHEKPPVDNPGWSLGWHQDTGSFLWHPMVRALTCWCPFTPVGRHGPGLKILAQRLYDNLFIPERLKLPGALMPDKVEERHPTDIACPEIGLGDCILFNNFTLHRTTYALGQTTTRHSLDFRLVGCDHAPPTNSDERVFMFPFERAKQFSEIAPAVRIYAPI